MKIWALLDRSKPKITRKDWSICLWFLIWIKHPKFFAQWICQLFPMELAFFQITRLQGVIHFYSLRFYIPTKVTRIDVSSIIPWTIIVPRGHLGRFNLHLESGPTITTPLVWIHLKLFFKPTSSKLKTTTCVF